MIGLILAQHNEIEFLKDCLDPWINYRKPNPLLIAALDVCFAENGTGGSTDGSAELLQNYKTSLLIDKYEQLVNGLKEHEARNVALKWLLEQGVELIISIGADEVFSLSQINEIFNYVEKDNLTALFKIHYKNYVGDKQHYVLGFKPNRVWRVSYNGWKLKELNFDDDAVYEKDGQIVSDKSFPTKVIPGVFVRHLTWLNGERSENKIIYQEKRWGKDSCSYKIDPISKQVSLNDKYYKITCQSKPEVLSDIS